MNRFKTILFAAIASFTINTSIVLAQNTNVLYGPMLKDQGKTQTTVILGTSNNGFYTLRSETSSFKALMNSADPMALEHYNNRNELVFSKPLPLQMPGEKKPNNLENILLVRDELYLFTSKMNESKGKYILYATKLNANGEIIGKTVEIAESEPKTKKQLAYFDITISPDKSKILVLESLKSQEAKFKIKVLDSGLKEVYQKEVSKKLPEHVYMKGYEIDNAGNVYIYHTSYVTSQDQILTNPVHNFLVYVPTQNQLKEYTVTIPGKIIADLSFTIDKNQKLAIGGLYANKHPQFRSGTFFMRIDPAEPKLQSFTTTAFSPELLAEFSGRSKRKDDNEGIHFMQLNNFLMQDDGSAILAAEQASQYQTAWTDERGRTSGKTEHYETHDVLVINMNPEGKTEWVARIPKLQQTLFENLVFSGFTLSTKGDKVYVIYNDHSKNINQTDWNQLKAMKNASDAVPVLVTIDKSGQFQKVQLELAKDKTIPLQPKYYFTNNETILLYGKQGSNYRFGKISYN